MTLIGETLMAVLAGLLLNLTPCVLPAIPLKMRVILREAGSKPRQRWLAALALLTGSLCVFLALGTATALLQLTWGALFQSKLFLLFLVLLLSIAGLATLFELRFPLPQTLLQVRGRRYVEPFLIGALTGLLSTPCTGPFLAGVLAFALTKPPGVIVWFFAAVGFGLALPHLALLSHPQWLEHIPRAGQWTSRLMQSLGFVLLAGAVFFAQSLVSSPWDFALYIAGIAAAAIWMVRVWMTSRTWAARLAPGGTAALVAMAVYVSTLPASSAPSLRWQPVNAGALEISLNAHRAALIEFMADWCINCKVLERTVYRDPKVLKAAESPGIATLQVDLTRTDKALEAFLVSFGGLGLPFAVVLDAEGSIVRQLPDLFAAETLAQAIYESTTGGAGDEPQL